MAEINPAIIAPCWHRGEHDQAAGGRSSRAFDSVFKQTATPPRRSMFAWVRLVIHWALKSPASIGRCIRPNGSRRLSGTSGTWPYARLPILY